MTRISRTDPVAIKATEPRYVLRNKDGQYLHFSCERFTEIRDWAWRDNAERLRRMMKKFPLAKGRGVRIERWTEK